MTNEISNSEASKPLSNAKHEKFAQGIANGMTQVDAYAEAGYKINKGASSVASKLTTNIQVSARVEFLKHPSQML